MAGDWIKMRSNLWDDPRVAKVCDITDQPEAAVIGAMYWLWAMADQHTEDGILPGLSLRQIDRKTGVQGFAQAMCEVGWLAEHPEGVRIVRFEEHNGASAKKRAATAKRVASHRAGNAETEPEPTGCNADVTQQALQDGSEIVTGALAREEKRREEKRREESSSLRSEERQRASRPPSLGEDFLVAQGVPAQAAKDWLKVRKSHRAPLTESAWEGIVSEASKAGITPAEAVQVCARKDWRGFNHAWDWQSAGVVGGAISTAKARNRQEERRNTMAALGGEFVTGASHATGDYIDV